MDALGDLRGGNLCSGLAALCSADEGKQWLSTLRVAKVLWCIPLPGLPPSHHSSDRFLNPFASIAPHLAWQ